MKSILTLAALAAAVATPAFASVDRSPDAGATAFLTLISAGALLITKNVMKKR
jgi:hypothetical protein